MPVEVKELIVRVIVEDQLDGSERGDEESGSSGYNDQETIVAECVRQVLKIIKQSKSR